MNFSSCRNYWGGGGKTICLPPQYFHWGRLPPPPQVRRLWVAQKECNTYDHYFQRNQGLDHISECIKLRRQFFFQQNDTKISDFDEGVFDSIF